MDHDQRSAGKNKDKWLELIRGKQGHLCSFYLKQPNAYTKELMEEMERREKTRNV